MNAPPIARRLFKYRPLLTSDGKIDQWTKSIFSARELWFAAPKSFNDPFDCNLLLHAEGTDDEKDAYLLSICDQEMEHLLKCSGKKPWKDNPSFFEEAAADERKKLYAESSVFCWSAIGNNVLMFSHYADSHRGICLEFEVTPNDFIGKVEPVIYERELPELNYLRLYKEIDRPRLTKSLVLTKEWQWHYEEEWRVFRYGERNGHVGFQDHHLKRVILGGAGGADEWKRRKEAVMNLLADWKTPVMLAQAEPSKSSFRLEIHDLGIVHG